MRNFLISGLMACGLIISAPAFAQHAAHGGSVAKVAPRAVPTLLRNDTITAAPGMEAMLHAVDFPPGSEYPVHLHDALVYVYVVKGSVVMQVRGKPEVTLRVGDTFVEQPDDIHVVGRNASRTMPARILAYFVKKSGVSPVLPAE